MNNKGGKNHYDKSKKHYFKMLKRDFPDECPLFRQMFFIFRIISLQRELQDDTFHETNTLFMQSVSMS